MLFLIFQAQWSRIQVVCFKFSKGCMPQQQKEGTTANFCAMVALITGANENSTCKMLSQHIFKMPWQHFKCYSSTSLLTVYHLIMCCTYLLSGSHQYDLAICHVSINKVFIPLPPHKVLNVILSNHPYVYEACVSNVCITAWVVAFGVKQTCRHVISRSNFYCCRT